MTEVPTWLELRIHGVSGTPVESLLSVPGSPGVSSGSDANMAELENVGFGTSEFWRRTDALIPPRELEAYHWGEYTARSPAQAFWILLLPFGVINAAQFMLPEPTAVVDKLLHALAGSCLRVIGLALSCLAFLSLGSVFIDRIGWYAIGRHRGLHYEWLGAFGVLIALLLWWARALIKQRRNGVSPASSSPPPPTSPPTAPPSGLHREGFYTGAAHSPDARRLHAAAILAMLALLVSSAGAQAGDTALGRVRTSAVWLLVVVAVTVFLSGDPEGGSSVVLPQPLQRVAHWLQQRVLMLVSWSAWVVSLAVLACAVLGAFVIGGVHIRSAQTLPGFDDVARWLLRVALVGLIVLFVAVAPLAARTRTDLGDDLSVARAFGRYAWGLASFFSAALAVFVGVGFAGAVAVVPAAVPDLFADPPHVPYPDIMQRVLFAWGWTVVALAIVLGGVLARYKWSLRDRYRAACDQAFSVAGPLGDPAAKRVTLWMFCARLKTLIPRVAVVFGTWGIVLSVAAAAQIEHWSWRTFRLVRLLAGNAGGFVVAWKVMGAVLLIAIIVAVAYLTVRAFGSTSSRRGLNVVWDVICFWPRSIHPFVPAAYSQFVVAELRQYVSASLNSPARGIDQVVLAPHSQGSLISLASLLWLPPDDLARTGLLSYGSQLRQIYPRAFPAYVNVDVISGVRSSLDERWLNLYRDTDHIAGPVFTWAHRRSLHEDPAEAVSWPGGKGRIADVLQAHGRRVNGGEWRLLDPMLGANDALPDPSSSPEKHSNYWLDSSWNEAVSMVRPTSGGTSARDGAG